MIRPVNILPFFVLLSLAICTPASSGVSSPQQTNGDNEETGSDDTGIHSEEKEKLPVYEGEGSFYVGFRLVDLNDSSKAAEYVEDKSSVTFGADGIACPLPHRYNLHGEYLGENDYYGDFGYAYRDLVLFKNILVGVHHNLEHYNYSFLGAPPAITYEDRSSSDENFVDFVKNELSLRLKAPDYPFHAFTKYKYLDREGAIEERFLIWDIANLKKISESREINWESNDLTLGMNSHLGPVEVEYAYSTGEFDPGTNNVLYDAYPPLSFLGRPGDIYPHNVFPETKTRANSVKIHSSYTGQIVASASFSNTENTNNYSNAESDIWKAAFDLRWIPDPVVSMSFRYRHREEDKDNPANVTLFGQTHQLTYPVRSLISSRKDVFSLSARYRPMSRLTLITDYDYEKKERSDLDEWEVLPQKTDIHRVSLTAHARPMKNLTLKGVYDFEHYENPSYNTEPDNLNRIRLNATYTPVTWATAYFDYTLALSDRDDLRYLNNSPHQVLTDGERDGTKNHVLGSLSFILSPEATITASWAYYKWKVEQDLTYGRWQETGFSRALPYYDLGVPYTDTAHIFSISMLYELRKDLTLNADLSYTMAEGEYVPADVIQGESVALSTFSSTETTETIVTLELAKKLSQDWEIGLAFSADIYDDKFSHDGGDHQDGELYITSVSLKRYF